MSQPERRQPLPEDGDTLTGAQALAWGALAAGVRTVTGYPGSPITAVFEALAALTAPGEINLHWAPNERVAMEIAIGASIAGSRSLALVKSVGLNVGLDPLATMSYTGIHAGMVVLLGDDPGAWGSQNEQDSRWHARIAEVPVVEPTEVASGAAIMAQAFAWSESVGTPLVLRTTRSFTIDRDQVAEPWTLPQAHKPFLRKHNRWIVLPAIAIPRHKALHDRLRRLARLIESSPYDRAHGDGPLGVVAVGHTGSKLRRALADPDHAGLAILSLSSSWPLPEDALSAWLQERERVLVLEEGGPFVEEGLRELAQRRSLAVPIEGRTTRFVPEEGELTSGDIARALGQIGFAGECAATESLERSLPSEVPLCEGCLYRPVFDALAAAMEAHGGRGRFIVVGETGCMVRANLEPWRILDIKYSLGSSIGLATGVAMNDTRHHAIALVGDSSFFHTDIAALPHLVQLGAPATVIVLDNKTTGLTGGQAHPGSTRDERGQDRERPADIGAICRACGIEPVACQAQDETTLYQAVADAVDHADGQRWPKVLIVQAPCSRYS